MHRLFLSLISLVIVAGIGCTTGTPSSSVTPGPLAATETPLATPTALAESPAAVTPEEFFLLVSSPQDESVVDHSPFEVQGSTLVEAVVTINGQVIDVGPQGNFASSVDLEEGPNIIEVIASDFSGHEEALMLSVIYIP